MRADLTELIKSLCGFVSNAQFVIKRSHRGTNDAIFPTTKTNLNRLSFRSTNNCYSWCKSMDSWLSISDVAG